MANYRYGRQASHSHTLSGDSSYSANHERFEREHDHALQQFRTLRKSFERSACCGSTFVLADLLTERLHQPSPTATPQPIQNLYHLMLTAHSKQSLEPPDLTPNDLKAKCRIFYILLEMGCPELVKLFHQLYDAHLPIDRAVLERTIGRDTLEDELGNEWEMFCEGFCEAQTKWCPLLFDSNMHAVVNKQIIPFYQKTSIEPYKDGREGNYAKLYEIHVPEELVGAKLRARLKSANLLRRQSLDTGMVDGEDQPILQECRYYRLAIKEFPKDMKMDFDRERKAFDALGEQTGMIQYFGWYESRIDAQHTYNILLEFADFDFFTAIRQESPPISPTEIKGFWEAMLGISTTLGKIHHLTIHGIKYDFWHGDIKPENILRVQDQFKLADPGEARIQRASEDDDQPPRIEVYGGTRTYAAPEKAGFLDGISQFPAKILQNSDVWSLGCVFSIAATYVVLGTQGVLLYDHIRRRAHAQASSDIIRDAFHDGTVVLPVIKQWHEYLRSSARLTDAFTERVFAMVDDHMLVMPAEDRWDATQVSERLAVLISNPQIHPLPVPGSIETILQHIDLEAEIFIESSVDVNRVDSDIAKKEIQGSRRLREDSSATTQFKSGVELFNTRILPTAQRSEHRSDLLRKYTPSRPPLGLALSSPGSSTVQRAPSSLTITTTMSHDTQEAAITSLPLTEEPIEESHMTMWQMEDELEAIGKERSLGSLRVLKDALKAAPVSVKGRIKNDPLANKYRQRDIIYLVDNGSSMERHWREAIHLLRVLVWRSLGYDDDGMELYFTNPDTKESVIPHKHQHVSDFVEAMKAARPKPPGRYGSKTNLYPELQKIMTKYVNDRRSLVKEKRKTIIIFTDGVWEDMTREEELEDVIKFTLNSLADLHRQGSSQGLSSQQFHDGGDQSNLEHIRPITIQFVAFGQNPNGLARMSRLDNDLKAAGFPDLIDMEPSNGDVYKMFLGSLNANWDKKVNRANSTLPSTPIRSDSSFSLGPDRTGLDNRQRGDTLGSELTSSAFASSARNPQQSPPIAQQESNFSSANSLHFAPSPSPETPIRGNSAQQSVSEGYGSQQWQRRESIPAGVPRSETPKLVASIFKRQGSTRGRDNSSKGSGNGSPSSVADKQP